MTPAIFLLTFHQLFPHFAEPSPNGNGYKQQVQLSSGVVVYVVVYVVVISPLAFFLFGETAGYPIEGVKEMFFFNYQHN